MRIVASMLVLLGFLLGTPVAVAAPESGRYAAIDAYVRDRMDAMHVPGLSYAVVGPNGPIHQRSWGVDGWGKPVTPRTPFLWGSVAKPVTATAVMTLVEAGRLRLDDRVVDYVPTFRFGSAAHAGAITVRHLLRHTSGLPESATFAVTDCFDSVCGRPTARLAALNGLEPTGAPGTTYAYTSANYLVLAAVVEAVTKRPFAEYLRQAVLDPAGMDSAIAGTASAHTRDLSPGHQLLWGVPAAIADEVDDHGASYGYLGGDLTDLAAFAALQLRSGDAVLTPHSVRLMRQEDRLKPTNEPTGYALGWRIGGLDAPLDHAIWHTGATPGYSAMLFVLPERNRALVLQQNLYGVLHDGAVMQVGFGAARLLAGGRPGDAPSAWTYHATIWGSTVLALVLVVAAARSVRRPRIRPAATVAWVMLGTLPWIAMASLISQMGVRQLLIWTPDTSIALAVAGTAGAVTIVLRLVTAIRRPTGTPRRQLRAERRRRPLPASQDNPNQATDR